MIKMDLQLFGGRGAGSGLQELNPTPGGGGGGGKESEMDYAPGAPKSLTDALGKKGRPMATTKAVAGANPFYSASYREYSENCQRCVAATEARFRGYNVVALPTFKGDTMPYLGNYAKSWEGAKINPVKGTTARAMQRNLESQMKSHGDGSRAVMRVKWKGCQSGHVLNVVQRNGKTYYYDGQTGGRYNPNALFNAISVARGDRSYTTLTRVDNLQFSNDASKAFRTNPNK